jgi:hypothetical protein
LRKSLKIPFDNAEIWGFLAIFSEILAIFQSKEIFLDQLTPSCILLYKDEKIKFIFDNVLFYQGLPNYDQI